MLKKFILMIAIALFAVPAFAATVVLQWTQVTDPAVTKVNAYHTNAANCTALVPQTPAVSPWSLINSVAAPANTDSFTEFSGTWCWYATAASATDESAPSNVVSAKVPLGKPVLSISASP